MREVNLQNFRSATTSRCDIVLMQETPPTNLKIRREGRERAMKGAPCRKSLPIVAQIMGKGWIQRYGPSLDIHCMTS